MYVVKHNDKEDVKMYAEKHNDKFDLKICKCDVKQNGDNKRI